jgi:hypothetical protein
MTIQEFNINIRNKTKSERFRFWLQSILGVCISVFCIIYVNIKTDKLGNKIPISITYILLCVLAVSLIGMYQLLKKYRITTILNDKKSEIKYAAIVSAFAKKPIILKEESGNYMTLIYQKNKISVEYEIDLIYDETQICFVVIGRGYKNGGLIDFGSATKLRNIIITELTLDLNK